MNRSNTKIAAFTSGVGFIAATLAQLLLFRYSASIIGLEKIGLVVLLQSLLFLTRIIDIGVGPNLTRRLAASNICVKNVNFAQELWSTFLSVTVPTIIVSLIALFAVVLWPEIIGSNQNESEVITITIILCVSGSLASVVTILIAAHEGIGDLIVRGASTILFAIAVLGCGIPLVSNFGPIGYALAVPVGLAVQFILLTLNLFLLNANLRLRNFSAVLINARYQLRDNLTLNGISICRLLFEPLTKYLLYLLGTIESVAVFDILNKVMTAVRVLISTMLQPLLFKKSKQHAAGDLIIRARDQRILNITSIYLAVGSIASTVVIETVLFANNIAPNAKFIIILLGFSSAINMSGQLAYINLLAMAAYIKLLRIHILMVIANLAASILLGVFYGEKGVVVGYAVTMAIGGVALHRMAPQSIVTLPVKFSADTFDVLGFLLFFGITVSSIYLIYSGMFSFNWSITLTGLLAISFLFIIIRLFLRKN